MPGFVWTVGQETHNSLLQREKNNLKQSPYFWFVWCFFFFPKQKGPWGMAMGSDKNGSFKLWFVKDCCSVIIVNGFIPKEQKRVQTFGDKLWPQEIFAGGWFTGARENFQSAGAKVGKIGKNGTLKSLETPASSAGVLPNEDTSRGWFWSYRHKTNALLQAAFERHLQLQLLWNNEIYTVP